MAPRTSSYIGARCASTGAGASSALTRRIASIVMPRSAALDAVVPCAPSAAKAALPHCSGHGLRKADVTLAAANGATTNQLMVMFGWRTSRMAEHYTRQAEQKRLAGGGMHLTDWDRKGSGGVPLFPPRRTGGIIRGRTATKSTMISAIGARERTRFDWLLHTATSSAETRARPSGGPLVRRAE